MKKLTDKRLLVGALVSEQKSSSKKRGHPLPAYTADELYDRLENDFVFNLLYTNWINSGRIKDMRPSIDRLDDFKPYTFDNIQIVTFKENNNKSHLMSKEGATVNSNVVKIDVYLVDGTLIDTTHSLMEASRKYNVAPGGITLLANRKVLKKSLITTGYIFRYHNEAFPEFMDTRYRMLDMQTMEMIREFCTLNEAKEFLGIIDASPLTKACRNINKLSYKGYKWEAIKYNQNQ